MGFFDNPKNIGNVISGAGLLGDIFTSSEENKAGQRLQERRLEADKARTDKLINLAGQRETPFSKTELTPEGGTKTTQPFSDQALASREQLLAGDPARIENINRAATRSPLYETLKDAQATVDSDNALTQSTIDRAFEQAQLRTRQGSGGNLGMDPYTSNYDRNLLEAIGRVADQTRFGRRETAGELFQGAAERDAGIVAAIRAANRLPTETAPPPFDTGKDTLAATLLAQTPRELPDTPVTSPLSIAGRTVSTAAQRFALLKQQEEDRRQRDALIRAIGNSNPQTGGLLAGTIIDSGVGGPELG